jgi:hypothetical protein
MEFKKRKSIEQMERRRANARMYNKNNEFTHGEAESRRQYARA